MKEESTITSKDEMGRVVNTIHNVFYQLRGIVNGILEGSAQLGESTSVMSSASSHLADEANKQAASIEEMVSNIHQNSDNAMQTENIAIRTATGVKTALNKADMSFKNMKLIS
jgi:methyl-accepting chemotaxis protein